MSWRDDMQSSWVLVKDMILTLGGLTLIMVEVFAVRSPSDAVIVTGLAMSGIGASFHVGALVGGFIGKSSSPASQGSADEHH